MKHNNSNGLVRACVVMLLLAIVAMVCIVCCSGCKTKTELRYTGCIYTVVIHDTVYVPYPVITNQIVSDTTVQVHWYLEYMINSPSIKYSQW